MIKITPKQIIYAYARASCIGYAENNENHAAKLSREGQGKVTILRKKSNFENLQSPSWALASMEMKFQVLPSLQEKLYTTKPSSTYLLL